VNNTNLGAQKNFEQVLQQCTGDIILLCDQDDRWMPQKIERCIWFFQNQPAAMALCSNGRLMRENGELLGQTMWDSLGFSKARRGATNPQNLLVYLLLFGNIVTGTAMAFRRECLPLLLPFYLPWRTWHDHWMALQLSAMQSLYLLDEELLHYRLHPQQQVGFELADQPLASITKPADLWPLDSYDGNDFNGNNTKALVKAIFQYQTFSDALMAHCPACSQHVLQVRSDLRQALRKAKTNWLRHSMPWPSRKLKLLKHWLKGGEYLDVSLADVVAI
jgi:hypothetical protein